jgi:hypothetical protein
MSREKVRFATSQLSASSCSEKEFRVSSQNVLRSFDALCS